MTDRTLGAYVHVPFCASRCGYCDFNTYTAAELTRDSTTVSPATFSPRLISEIRLTAEVNHDFVQPLSSVFFGGGTPTLLATQDLCAILAELANTYGLSPDCEVTIEANPDSVDQTYLAQLKQGGFNRISFGHQSSSSRVLQILDRTHTAGRTWQAINWARDAGFEHINVDLIYGTPHETDADLLQTLAEVSSAPVDHVSAYSLIVEPGTRLAASIKRGELPMPSDDVAAHRYGLIDDALTQIGMSWYEVSNWSLPGAQCQHNIGYWQNQDWLGLGPGAHAHFNGLRRWNVKHPAAWANSVDEHELPIGDTEALTPADIFRENIMLGLRLKTGIPIDSLTDSGVLVANQALAEGLLEPNEFSNGALVLTYQGRLLADGLVARLWD
ncbi:MAG: coproporphyrinogen III oxidase [Actinobacteria bacterium]|nr:coproporphyrinogen III oxidase [Actinomycetota bacterium]